ncbi:MAG: class I SAM-dependent methyltransferase [Dehalococcoidales bacterium]|nr:class I SAM-dependent methyltransferase [Dehalococcoidales bacterium]
MAISDLLIQKYFDIVYNPTYDATVGQFQAYRTLQERCIAACDFANGDRVLCVGAGTGNEIAYILARNPNVTIFAVDTSEKALTIARDKAANLGYVIHTLKMDARRLAFAEGAFDKVVSIHLMDFVPEAERATGEILRVLRVGGQFVVTYPFDREGAGLGASIVKDGILANLHAHRFKAALSQLGALLGVSAVFTPLFLRPQRRVYVKEQVTDMYLTGGAGAIMVQSDSVYVDLIVSGKKERSGADVSQPSATGRRVLLQPQRGRNLAQVLRVP